MKIGILGSMQFTDKMLETAEVLRGFGHEPVLTGFIERYAGKDDDEIEKLKLEDKNHHDAMREFWDKMQDLDAVLVLNLERKGIPNYIGGNTLMEIGFAHVLNLKIFLYNPIPEIDFYKTEIEAMKPVIINSDLKKVVGPVEPGHYRHYKGGEYDVIGTGRHSETLAELVIYRARYGDRGLWVRPLEMWNEEVDVQGKIVKRFILLESNNNENDEKDLEDLKD